MFYSARLKLTAWYLLIIMFISVLFSIEIYTILTHELERGYRILSSPRTEERIEILNPNDNSFSLQPRPRLQIRSQLLDPSYLQEAEERIKLNLLYVNLVIFGLSGIIGYFLAGRTLRPIKIMVDEQNRFIADASHELKTPLTVLKSEIEVYLRSKKTNLKEANNLIKSNLEEINTLQALSDDLLQLARAPKQNGNNFFREISLAKITEQAIKKVFSLAKNKKINIVNNTKGELVYGDESSLVQLLVILLENAIKYSPKKTKVTITSVNKDKLLFIKIIDQGVGIDKKDIPHIFDRFFRADISRSKINVAGYGLGLSIAKKILDLHKGSIGVESKIGKGTIFTIQLPNKS